MQLLLEKRKSKQENYLSTEMKMNLKEMEEADQERNRGKTTGLNHGHLEVQMHEELKQDSRAA